MKTRNIILTLGVCITMIMCSFAGCTQEAPDSEEENTVENTTALTTKTVKKEETRVTTTMHPNSFEETDEAEEDNEEDEEVIFDAEDSFDLPPLDVKSSNLKLELVQINNVEYTKEYSCGLCPFQDSFTGMWGYLDQNMNIAIEPQFFDALNFYEGYAGVFDGYNWGFIDKTGKYTVDAKYSEILDLNKKDNKGAGFLYEMALVGDAQNDDEPSWVSTHKDYYYIIDYYGNENFIDYSTYLNLFYNTLSFCNGIIYVNDLGGEVKILNNDGTINSRKSLLFQDIAADGSYSKYTMVDKSYGSDNVINYSNSKLVFMNGFPPAYVAAVIITDVNKSFVFDLKDLPEFQQLRSIQLCDNLLITKREINDIEQSAVYDYNKNLIINYKYKNILPVVVNGNAEYFVCYGNNDDSIVVDKNGNSNDLLDKYCHLNVMTSYDDKTYLLGIYKSNKKKVDIIDFTSNAVITTFISNEMDLLWSTNKAKYEYAGIHNGVILIANEKRFIVYDYINDHIETVSERLNTNRIFLDKGVCNLDFHQSYYKITGFPLE